MGKNGKSGGIYGGADPRDLPAYPLPEVAHFLWIARANVGRWALGYEAGKKHQPVIRVADPRAGSSRSITWQNSMS